MKYRPEVDGLRAVAVLPVLAFHAGASVMAGGFLGVDVFFVISGYLISSILFREIGNGTFTFRRFYERRIRRILPAYFAVVLACFPAALLLLDATALESFAESAVASNFWVANIYFWRQIGYFKTSSELQPLLHMWSLAVEEQFYLFFPILLLVLFKVRRHWLNATLIIAVVLSFSIAEYGALHYPSPSFYLLPTRAWELGIGALAALHDEKLRQAISARFHSALAWFGLTAILASMFMIHEASLVPGHGALGATAGTALVLVFASATNGVGRLLSRRAFVSVGLISYSLYLWHQPLFAFARVLYVSLTPPGVMASMALASMVLAYLSWRFVEAPFRSREKVSTRAVMFAFVATLAATTALAAGVARWAKSIVPVAEDVLEDTKANQGLHRKCNYQRQAMRGPGPAFHPSEKCHTSAPPPLLLWGDSFAMHLVTGFTENALPVAQATFSGCPPSPFGAPFGDKQKHTAAWAKRCLAFNEQVLAYVQDQPSIEVVVVSSPFRSFVVAPEMMTANGVRKADDAERVELFMKMVAAVEATGKRVVVISPPPGSGANIGDCLRRKATGLPVLSHVHAQDCSWPRTEAPIWRPKVDAFLSTLQANAVEVISLSDALCRDGECKASLRGIRLYRDTGHLTKRGAAILFREKGIAGRIKQVLAND